MNNLGLSFLDYLAPPGNPPADSGYTSDPTVAGAFSFSVSHNAISIIPGDAGFIRVGKTVTLSFALPNVNANNLTGFTITINGASMTPASIRPMPLGPNVDLPGSYAFLYTNTGTQAIPTRCRIAQNGTDLYIQMFASINPPFSIPFSPFGVLQFSFTYQAQ